MLLFQYSNQRLQAFAEFIDNERENYVGDNNNLVAHALESIFRRYRFAWRLKQLADPLICQHIGESSVVMESSYSGPLNANGHQALAENMVRADEILMLFESFMMHSSIMCDDLAHLLLYLYGDQRGVKMGGHRHLSKNFVTYANAKGLVYQKSLPENAEFLERELCDFRDKQLVHDLNPRKFRALSWNLGIEDIKLSGAGFIYPKSTDVHVSSRGWKELLERLDGYVWLMLGVVEANRMVSRFSHA